MATENCSRDETRIVFRQITLIIPTVHTPPRFFAGALPQSVNIALSRQKELLEGIVLFEDAELTNPVPPELAGTFASPALTAWALTWATRVAWAAPSLGGTAIVMSKLEPWLLRRGGGPLLPRGGGARGVLPATLAIYGALLVPVVPMGLALFHQVQAVEFSQLRGEEQDRLKRAGVQARKFYFNKGL